MRGMKLAVIQWTPFNLATLGNSWSVLIRVWPHCRVDQSLSVHTASDQKTYPCSVCGSILPAWLFWCLRALSVGVSL